VSEASPNKTSTPIRIENKNQFAPQGTNPKELKEHQKQVHFFYFIIIIIIIIIINIIIIKYLFHFY
jgi:hypothetical protein